MTCNRFPFAPDTQTRNSLDVVGGAKNTRKCERILCLKLSRVKWLSSAAPEEKEKIAYARHRSQDTMDGPINHATERSLEMPDACKPL